MPETSERKEYEKLQEDLRKYGYYYYVQDSPIISDAEYDAKYQRLQELEREHPDWITSGSPTQRAGAEPLANFKKVTHPAPILSLAAVYDKQALQDWYDRIAKLDDRVKQSAFTLEPKLDGLTVVLRYDNGIFTQGATRGNGEIGEDITANLRTVNVLPLRIPVDPDGPAAPEVLYVRGEALIYKADFDRLNKQLEEAGEKTYLNPRNTAAGSLRQLDPRITAQRPLKMLVYAIVAHENGDIPATQWETLEYLRALGFPVAKSSNKFETIQEAIDATVNTDPDTFPFEVDGMVIKLNDLALMESLGVVGKDPRGAIAYKFPAEEVSTKLENIEVTVGRTGVLTPNAILQPVEIRGAIIKQATLHNFDYIAEKDIRIGDRVMIKRAGEVIPYVIGPVVDVRDGSEKPYVPPKVCPSCGEPVVNPPGEVAYYCVNSSCPAQLIRNLEHFISQGAMDIVGMGINTVKQLVNAGLLQDISGLYRLTKDDLMKLEGFGDKKADNLLAAIETSKSQSLARLINALGIRGVGEVAAQDLARRYHDLNELSQVTGEQIESMEGFGPSIAENLTEWFASPDNHEMLARLKSSGVWPIS
ncbi:MAG: NAD-dependent DNA ligase LigA, partial [Anaerolineaceae bacterium]|nr:NAD-dependent DNA ligase LigA [Anaerolineaceae bacterium]